MSLLTDEEVKEIRLSIPAVCNHADLIRHTEKFIESKFSALRAENKALKQQVEQGKRDAVPDAETVQCFLYALLNEAKRRGGMFPQSSDEQDSDSDAIHRVCKMVEWYGKQNEPHPTAVENLRSIRARNMASAAAPKQEK